MTSFTHWRFSRFQRTVFSIPCAKVVFSAGVELLFFKQHSEFRPFLHSAPYYVDNDFHYVDVALLVVSSHVVNASVCAVVYYEVDSLAMVFNVKPVAHIEPLSVNGEFLSFQYIVYYKWNQFFGEMIGPVVV